MCIGYDDPDNLPPGYLILGSFDFNREGIGDLRKDAGIITENPELVEAALSYFNDVWESSSPLS